MSQPTAEDRMGALAKSCAIALVLCAALLFSAAAVGLWGYLQRGSMPAPAPGAQRLELLEFPRSV